MNSVVGLNVVNAKGLSDADKWLVKRTVKQSGYKQIGKTQDINFNGDPAKQTKLEGRSKVTGKAESIVIINTLTKDNRLLYIQSVYPSNSTVDDLKVFDEIHNSVNFL